MKKTKLKYQPEYSFLLLAISSHENDYHLSWAINKELGLQLARAEDLVISKKSSITGQTFSVFSYEDEKSFLLFNLISNTGESGYLFPEFKNIDFFLQIYGDTPESFRKELPGKLKNIQVISTCFYIPPTNLKTPGKLLFN